MPVYLRMQNPFVIEANADRTKWINEYHKGDYDGIIDLKYDTYYVEGQTQIKSATDNIGTFSQYQKDIRHSHKSTSDTDRVTITKGALAKLKANYEGEKVFNKKDISAALNNIEALNVLSKSERYSLASKLFEGYNIRLDAEHYEQFSEIMYNKIRARILQESDFELSAEETSIMDEQIVKALNDIVASGKESTRAKLEYSVFGNSLTA